MAFITRTADGSIIRYGLTESELYVIPNLSAGNVTGGEAPTREDVAFEGIAQHSAKLRPQTVEAQSFSIPDHPSWDAIFDAAEKQDVLWWQIELPGEEVFSEATAYTVGFDATGKVLFEDGEGNPPDPESRAYGPGHSFALSAAIDSVTLWPIDRVVEEGSASDQGFWVRSGVQTPVEQTGGYKIVLPTLKRTFRARVGQTSADQIQAENSIGSPLNLVPLARLPKWVATAP